MSICFFLPPALRRVAGGMSVIPVFARTAGAALEELATRSTELQETLFAAPGQLRENWRLYLNHQELREPDELTAALPEGAALLITPKFRDPAEPVASAARPPAPENRPAATANLPKLSREERLRYGRHLSLEEIGISGQRKLKNARVLIVGAGGLGSPAALYLAAAGVGAIGLIDFDAVDETNLQRQILYSEQDQGRAKTAAAGERLTALNRNIHMETFSERLSSQNALDLIRDYDVVIDGSDNFTTRYLVNDACAMLGKPDVFGSVFRFEGQLSVFWAGPGPCYRCLFPQIPPPGSVPSCAEAGVLGVLPGVIGSLQASEAIKLILGGGEPLIGRLMLFNAWHGRFREMQLRRDANCPLCGKNPTIHELQGTEMACSMPPSAPREISAADLKQWLAEKRDFQLIDVREPYEAEAEPMPGSKLIPLGQIVQRAGELDPARAAVIFCHAGIRGARAIEELRGAGHAGELLNLAGGMLAWAAETSAE